METATAKAPALPPLLVARLTEFAPSILPALTGFHEAAWASVDAVLLELARLRIAMLLGDANEAARRSPAAIDAGLQEEKVAALGNWPDSPLYTEGERACLAFTEQYVGDVANLTKADADAVIEHLGAAGFYRFVNALLALDEHARLNLALARVFGPGSTE